MSKGSVIVSSGNPNSFSTYHQFSPTPLPPKALIATIANSKLATILMPLPVTVAKPASPLKRLTDVELQKKRDKGLCYRCKEKFKPDHKCSNRELQVLVVQEENRMEQVEAPEEEEGDELGELIELSIKSVLASLRLEQ